jgi:translation initiation factor 3 subunit L
MYALFAICNSLSPSRLDDNIANIAKERFAEQCGKMSRGSVNSLIISHCVSETVQ